MCGRFVIYDEKPFGLNHKPSYNICPFQIIPVLTKENCALMKWCYSPKWKIDMNLINCRSETIHIKPSFRNAKRCVIYNNGWYEWKKNKTEKIPYFHKSKSNYFAGIYNDTGCLILTRSSVKKINKIHHRQPVLLHHEDLRFYLDELMLYGFELTDNFKVSECLFILRF